MTGRFIAPDNGVKAVSVEGMRTGSTQNISRDSKGFFNAETSAQAKALKAEGFIEASLNGVASKTAGYLCNACGFNGWFKKCGRCESEDSKKANEE